LYNTIVSESASATTLRIEVPEVEAAEATKFLAAPPE
jgi:hypothetical protein